MLSGLGLDLGPVLARAGGKSGRGGA